jgi:hypothetical protein
MECVEADLDDSAWAIVLTGWSQGKACARQLVSTKLGRRRMNCAAFFLKVAEYIKAYVNQ